MLDEATFLLGLRHIHLKPRGVMTGAIVFHRVGQKQSQRLTVLSVRRDLQHTLSRH
jgi:hypothetical protein